MESSATRLSLLSRLRDLADQESWCRFDERYRDLILRYCRREGLQSSDAEDVRQVVMVALARTLPSFRYRPERGSFRAYLGRIVRNAVLRRRDRSPARTSFLAGDEVDALVRPVHDGEGADAGWEREWVQHHFRVAMARAEAVFEPKTLAMFTRLLEGAAPEDVARDFAVGRDTVYKARQRVRDHLKALIAEQVRDEELGEPPGHDT